MIQYVAYAFNPETYGEPLAGFPTSEVELHQLEAELSSRFPGCVLRWQDYQVHGGEIGDVGFIVLSGSAKKSVWDDDDVDDPNVTRVYADFWEAFSRSFPLDPRELMQIVQHYVLPFRPGWKREGFFADGCAWPLTSVPGQREAEACAPTGTPCWVAFVRDAGSGLRQIAGFPDGEQEIRQLERRLRVSAEPGSLEIERFEVLGRPRSDVLFGVFQGHFPHLVRTRPGLMGDCSCDGVYGSYWDGVENKSPRSVEELMDCVRSCVLPFQPGWLYEEYIDGGAPWPPAEVSAATFAP